jgi:hypothetical protein
VRHHQKQTQEGNMNDDDRTKEALFRHAILGEVLSRSLRRGELRLTLIELSEKMFEDYQGRPRRIAHKPWRNGYTSTVAAGSKR